MTKLLYTIDEAGEVLGHKRTFLYELLQSGKLESVKAGKRRLIVAESIQRYVASLRAAA
ncbi:MAG: helix-turn-helix domain-containing protein [Rhizobiaceae bacterium]